MHHLPDGKTDNPEPLKPGEVLFAPPTRHAPENIGKAPAEVILVELKPRCPAKTGFISC